MKAAQRFVFTSFVSLIVVPLLALSLGAPPAFAQQDFNFQNFSSTANLTLNGSAARVGNVLRLTPAQAGKVGSAWFNTQQVVTKGFTTSFQFKITNPSETPADGIAFVIQNAGLAALGGAGGGIGYSGITHSLAVEFDTFQNGGNASGQIHDPDNNHVAIQSCNMLANKPIHNSPFFETNPGCLVAIMSVSLPRFADGNVHTVVVNYDPPCIDCETPNLIVYLDGNTPVLRASFDITSLGLGGEGEDSAFVGFTASTESESFFENQDILNWSFSPHSGDTQNRILIFNPGTHVSQTASFDCGSTLPPCPGANASSLKLTVGQVNEPIAVVVSETLVDGDGSCETGSPNNADFDCRFVNHFGTPGITPAVTVPLCYPYKAGGRCAYYRVENPPSNSKYLGPVDWYIAWNDDSFVTSGACAAKTFPTTYQCTNPQMADDPSTFHPDPNQFTTYITTYFNPDPGQVGKDPGLGGKTDAFNDVAAVFPQTGPHLDFTLLRPLTPSGPNAFPQGENIVVRFRLKNGNIVINNATTPPHSVKLAILDSNRVSQPVSQPGEDPTPAFVFRGGIYHMSFNTDFLAPGTYTLLINSDLFSQQTIPFTITPEH